MRRDNELLITMTKKELDDIVFKASKVANDKLFSGIAAFLYDYQEQFRLVLEELEYLKLLIKQNEKPKPVKSKKANKESKKKTVSEITSSVVTPDSMLEKFIKNMTDEQKKQFEQNMKQAIEQARIINQPNITLPDGFK
jgi:formate dehydrogenase maturation protein FdhE